MLSKARTKYIQSLYHKKFRDESDSFIIEGPKIVAEFVLHISQQIESIYATASWLKEEETLLRLVQPGSIHEISESELKTISGLSSPNQVLAVAKKWNRSIDSLNTESLNLMLDGIRDPGNMGTIIRIADWFGVKSILCSADCVELYNPKVVQSTMASIIRVDVFYLDLESWLEANRNVKVFAATMGGKPVQQFTSIKKGIVIIGNESVGINPRLVHLASDQITIPSIGKADSLNAAVATGIILSHLLT